MKISELNRELQKKPLTVKKLRSLCQEVVRLGIEIDSNVELETALQKLIDFQAKYSKPDALGDIVALVTEIGRAQGLFKRRPKS